MSPRKEPTTRFSEEGLPAQVSRNAIEPILVATLRTVNWKTCKPLEEVVDRRPQYDNALAGAIYVNLQCLDSRLEISKRPAVVMGVPEPRRRAAFHWRLRFPGPGDTLARDTQRIPIADYAVS